MQNSEKGLLTACSAVGGAPAACLKPAAYRLEGSSMSPLFRPGGIAFIEPVRPGVSPRAGDCAVYEYNGRVLLHRVVGTDRAGVRFADDAGLLDVHSVPWRDVRGKVISGNPLANGLPGLLYSKARSLLGRFLRAAFNEK